MQNNMQNKSKLQVKKTDYGLASRVGDIIYLNKDLDKYPKLKEALLKHEREHTSKYSLKDFLLDFKGKHLQDVKREYYLFLFKYPKSLVHFLPIWTYDKTLVIDPIMTFLWILLIACIIFMAIL